MKAPTPDQIERIERQVIGAAMLDPLACAQAVALAPSGRMLYPDHRDLMRCVERLVSEGVDVTPATMEAAGAAPAWVSHCLSSRPDPTAVEYLASVLAAGYLGRESRTILARAAQAVVTAHDPAALIADVQRELSDLLLSGTAHAPTHISHAVDKALARVDEWERGEATDFAPSGFYTLDRVTGGYPVGELTTLAAQTGAGKTSLVCQAVRSIAVVEVKRAKHAGREPAPAVVFSAEMSAEQIAHRSAAGLARVNLRDLRARTAPPEDYERFRQALRFIRHLPLHVDDEPAPTFAHIRARLQQIRQAAPEGRLSLVAVDYDEKIDAHGDTEELRVSAIARGLKETAKRFAVAILGLSQYKRIENAHRHPPANDWLRYSGKKEHESAMVIHWWHPGYWAEKGIEPMEIAGYDPARPQAGQLIITKNRFGQSGTIALDFDAATTSFHDPNEPEAVRALRAPSTNGVLAPF